jgi:hypothetical protein
MGYVGRGARAAGAEASGSWLYKKEFGAQPPLGRGEPPLMPQQSFDQRKRYGILENPKICHLGNGYTLGG